MSPPFVSRLAPARSIVAPLALLLLATSSGCCHLAFEQNPLPVEPAGTGPPPATVRYERRVATWLYGFVGVGAFDTGVLCAEPVSTELYVSAADVAVSIATLFIYTPHTLRVVCPAPGFSLARSER